MIPYLLMILQTILLILLAPLFVGILRKWKAVLRGKKGNPITQMYYDLWKLMRKDRIISEHASFITALTPLISLSAVTVAALFVPVFYAADGLGFTGDFILVIYLIAIIKFFNSHSGLDASSTFGGMGGSREMFISTLAEPSIFLIFVYIFLRTGELTVSSAVTRITHMVLTPAGLAAAFGFFVVLLMENARIPVDNPETHLELTMVHEGMLLEYSGRDLALIELASAAKLILFCTLFVNLFLPGGVALTAGPGVLLLAFGMYLVKILIVLFGIALVEVLSAKYRVFRMTDVGAMAATSLFLAIILLMVTKG